MKLLSFVYLTACLGVGWLLPHPAFAQRMPDSLNACWLLKHPINLSSVERNARKIITKSDENCVLPFIDRLTDSSFGKNHHEYLACLGAIRKVSDGDISDDFEHVGATLFYKNFNHLFEYIYRENSTFNTSFEKMLIEAVALEIYSSADKAGEKARVAALLHRKEREMKLNGPQQAYVESLKDRIMAYKVE